MQRDRGSTIRGRRPIRPVCWPAVWLWIVSITQYSYRYILQVNDPSTSHLYGPTPIVLSAIKYEILIFFAGYALYRFLGRTADFSRSYRTLMQITAVALILFAAILLVRIAVFHGDMQETLLCALELIPWITIVFFLPMVVQPEHSATSTLMVFERFAFWIIFPFWLITAILAALGIRYPALSYPGLLIRCGGILDDPNGYACLCLLLLSLAASGRSGAWRFRIAIYIIMLIATFSLSGYAMAIFMLFCWLLLRLARFSGSPLKLARAAAVCGMALSIIPLLSAVYNTAGAPDAITSLYSAKSHSAAVHLSDLSPSEAMTEDSSSIGLLCGVGGFSENLYWRIFANFGLTGLLAIVFVVLLWSYYALWRSGEWHHGIGIWSAAFLVGSNGIAYLLTFPLSLIYWSALGLLVCTKRSNHEFEAQTASPRR